MPARCRGLSATLLHIRTIARAEARGSGENRRCLPCGAIGRPTNHGTPRQSFEVKPSATHSHLRTVENTMLAYVRTFGDDQEAGGEIVIEA